MPSATFIFGRLVLAACCVGIGAAAMHWGPSTLERVWPLLASTSPSTRSATKPAAVDTWTVRRGDMRITFVETGKLRAIKSYPIVPLISRQQLKISFLATEGATVKKDELIVSFDKKAFEEQLQSQKAELDGATRQLTVNQAAVEISKSTGLTAIALANTKLEDAQVLLKTYVELEGPKKLNELDRSINEARGKAADAQKIVAEAQAKIDDGLFSEEEQKKALERELADAEQSYVTFRKSVDAFILQRKIFRAYEYPQSMKTKRQAVESARMEVEKAKVTAENELNQKQADVAKVTDQITRLKRQIASLEDTIEKCDIRAPAEGLVVYGDPTGNGIRYVGQEVRVGSEWYGGQTIMTIPDLSAFEIDINVAENYVGKVAVDMPVNVTFEAVPNLKLDGKLKEVAKLGRPREMYDPTSPRVFTTAVSLDGSDPRLVSGMTGRVEIIADEVKNTLLVPVDAIATEQGRTIVMLRLPSGKTERREVKIARSNNSLVEVVEGLEEGDRLALGTDGATK